MVLDIRGGEKVRAGRSGHVARQLKGGGGGRAVEHVSAGASSRTKEYPSVFRTVISRLLRHLYSELAPKNSRKSTVRRKKKRRFRRVGYQEVSSIRVQSKQCCQS